MLQQSNLDFNGEMTFRPGTKLQYADILTSTWRRDSHDLFDFEAPPHLLLTTRFKIYAGAKIVRDNFSVSLKPENYELDPKEELLLTVRRSSDNTLWMLPASNSRIGSDGNPNNASVHSGLYKLVGPGGASSHLLEEGQIVKFGRYVLRVRTLDATGTRSPSITGLGSSVCYAPSDHTVMATTQCRFCLCDGSSEEDPLIQPCICKGSIGYVHLSCLRYWVSGWGRETNSDGKSVFYHPLCCELCKERYVAAVVSGNKSFPLVEIPAMSPPYVILEKSRLDGNADNEEGVFIVSLKTNTVVKLGRSHESRIRISDVSISRFHAMIHCVGTEFYLTDNLSKFGTVVDIPNEVRISDIISNQNEYDPRSHPAMVALQVGRTVMMVSLHNEMLTGHNLNPDYSLQLPIFREERSLSPYTTPSLLREIWEQIRTEREVSDIVLQFQMKAPALDALLKSREVQPSNNISSKNYAYNVLGSDLSSWVNINGYSVSNNSNNQRSQKVLNYQNSNNSENIKSNDPYSDLSQILSSASNSSPQEMLSLIQKIVDVLKKDQVTGNKSSDISGTFDQARLDMWENNQMNDNLANQPQEYCSRQISTAQNSGISESGGDAVWNKNIHQSRWNHSNEQHYYGRALDHCNLFEQLGSRSNSRCPQDNCIRRRWQNGNDNASQRTEEYYDHQYNWRRRRGYDEQRPDSRGIVRDFKNGPMNTRQFPTREYRKHGLNNDYNDYYRSRRPAVSQWPRDHYENRDSDIPNNQVCSSRPDYEKSISNLVNSQINKGANSEYEQNKNITFTLDEFKEESLKQQNEEDKVSISVAGTRLKRAVFQQLQEQLDSSAQNGK